MICHLILYGNCWIHSFSFVGFNFSFVDPVIAVGLMVSFVIDTVHDETTKWYKFGRESLMTCIVEVRTTGLCPCTQLGPLWKCERLGLGLLCHFRIGSEGGCVHSDKCLLCNQTALFPNIFSRNCCLN